MRYLNRLVTDLNNVSDGSPSIVVLLLEYTLVPEAHFPSQLKQASSLLSYLLNETQRAASDIMIAGDSAGGGLALSLLSHLRRPHIDIQTITLHQPLRGVFLFSPWVSYDTGFDSFARNAFKDVLVPDMLHKWAGMYLGTVDGEIAPEVVDGGNNYSEPLLANASWWEGMHDVVEDVWLFGGQDEVFIDALYAFGTKFFEGWKAGGGIDGKVEVQFARGEPHIGPIMDVMLQYKEKAQGQLALERWLEERLA
jgi:acetyl esterase/lipase